MVLLALPPLRRHFGVRILRALPRSQVSTSQRADPYAVQNYRELARDSDCGLSLLVV